MGYRTTDWVRTSSVPARSRSARMRRCWTALGVAALLGGGGSLAAEEIVGFSRPFREVEVTAPDPGVIVQLLVEEGQTVEKGQVLARLDSEILEASLAVARARAESEGLIEIDRIDLEFKRKRLAELVALLETQAARESEVDRARVDLAVAEAKLRSSLEEQGIRRLEVVAIEARLRRRTIESPVRGVVREVVRQVGEPVNIARPGIVRVVETGRLKAGFHVSLAALVSCELGDVVRVRFAHPDVEVEGRVSFIDPVADRASETVKIDVTIDNPDRALRAGARCRLRLGEAGSGE